MHCLARNLVLMVLALILSGMLPRAVDAGSPESASMEQTFQKAKADYLQKNLNAAAREIKKGEAFMTHQSQKASSQGKAAISASARELGKLANDVERGAVKSEKKIEETFARAYLALASDAHIKSTESWAKRESAKAGRALENANDHLEKSFDWAGHKIEKSTTDTMKQSEDLALKLKKQSSLVADDVNRGLLKAGNEIEKFGKKISP